MPDIEMCSNGQNCAKHSTCYRFNAKASDWQSYRDFYDETVVDCKHYWERAV